MLRSRPVSSRKARNTMSRRRTSSSVGTGSMVATLPRPSAGGPRKTA
jgi:hypothetical protein